MPFLKEQNDIILPDLINKEENINVPEIETSLGEATKRAFRYENIVGAIVSNKSRGNWVYDPEFNYSKAFASLPEEYQLSKSISSKFANAENEDHFNAIKEQIDQESSDREYLAAAGWKGVVANLAAGIFDPINLLPIGGVAYKVGKTGKKTYNVLNAGARTAMVGAGTISLQEAALHSQQESRTLGESAANISIGTLLSGVLGAGSYALLAKSPKYSELKKQLETELDITDFVEDVRQNVELQEKPGLSLSATATPKKSKAELLEENSLVRGGVFKPIMFQDPNLRMLSSPTVSSRLAVQEISEITPKLKKNLKGIATPKSVESERLLDEGRLADTILSNQDHFMKYKKRVGNDPNRLSRAEFNTEVSKALNRKGDSPIPEAAAAAVKNRELLKHYGKEGLEIEGFFGDGKAVQDTLDTYFPRQYNRATIAANPAKFQKKIADYFKSEYSKASGFDPNTKIFYYSNPYSMDSKVPGITVQNPKGVVESNEIKNPFDREGGKVLQVYHSKIDEDMRGKGFGSQLYLNLIDAAKEQGYKYVFSDSAVSESASKVWKRLGAKENQNIKNPKNDGLFYIDLQNFDTSKFRKNYSGQKARIYEDAIETLDESYFQRLALDVYDNVMGSSSSVLHDNVGLSFLPSFAKSRKLLMDNTEIEEFLEMDVDAVMTKYAKLMSSRTRLAKRFGMDFLDDNMQTGNSKIVQDIKEEYADLKAKVLDKPKELKKLKAREEQDLADLFALRDRLLGTYGYSINPDSWLYRAQRQVKQYNVVTMLGDVLASSIPDIGRLVMHDGFSRLFKGSVKPLIKSLYSPEFRKYLKTNIREAKRIGVALDLVNNHTVNARGDITDDFGRHTKFERGADYVSQKLISATGIKHWNTILKSADYLITQSAIHDAMSAVAGNRATKKQISNLARSGIDKQAARAIRAQIKKHGEIRDDIVFPNIAEWDFEAKELGEIYATAVRKEVDSTIVTPGIGTTPLWMSRNGLTLFGQFQSFAFSSMQKTLIPIVQDFDVKTVQGLTVMVGLGTLVAAYKRAARGEDLSDTKTLIQEGVDRSGTLAWLMDYNNRLEKLTKGDVGLSRILGTNATNKYYNYNNFAALGPTTGQINNIGVVAGSILRAAATGGDRGITQSTVHSARRLLPLQSMIGVRQTLDLMEKEFNNTMGIPKN